MKEKENTSKATQYLRGGMKSKGLSYDRLSKELDVSGMTPFHWVQNPENLPYMKLEKLVQVLELDMKELVSLMGK